MLKRWVVFKLVIWILKLCFDWFSHHCLQLQFKDTVLNDLYVSDLLITDAVSVHTLYLHTQDKYYSLYALARGVAGRLYVCFARINFVFLFIKPILWKPLSKAAGFLDRSFDVHASLLYTDSVYNNRFHESFVESTGYREHSSRRNQSSHSQNCLCAVPTRRRWFYVHRIRFGNGHNSTRTVH